MPNLNIVSIGMTGCQWYVDSLGFLWDTDQYNYIYIVINGSSSSPVFPPPPVGSGNSTSWGSFGGLSPSTTYNANAYAVTPSGTYSAGSATFTTLGPPRPSNFSWSTTKTSGANFNLTAAEWNSFTSAINNFRSYKSLSSYVFTSAFTGNDFTSTMFNQAVSAITGMGPPTSPPSMRSTGDDIYASYLNTIVSSLNSIP